MIDHYSIGYMDALAGRQCNIWYGRNLKEFSDYHDGYTKGFIEKAKVIG